MNAIGFDSRLPANELYIPTYIDTCRLIINAIAIVRFNLVKRNKPRSIIDSVQKYPYTSTYPIYGSFKWFDNVVDKLKPKHQKHFKTLLFPHVDGEYIDSGMPVDTFMCWVSGMMLDEVSFKKIDDASIYELFMLSIELRKFLFIMIQLSTYKHDMWSVDIALSQESLDYERVFTIEILNGEFLFNHWKLPRNTDPWECSNNVDGFSFIFCKLMNPDVILPLDLFDKLPVNLTITK